MKTSSSFNRRRFLQGTAAIGAAAAGSGIHPWTQWASAQELSGQSLRTTGLSTTVQDRILEMFKASSGVASVSGTPATFPDAQTKILSGSSDYDTWEIIAERLPALIATDNVEPIPVAEVPNWANIRDVFTTVDPRWDARSQITGQIWTDETQTDLYMVPAVYNYDSIGYNPEVLSDEEANTWTAIFDEKWQGKSGLNVDPLIAIGQAVLAMNSLGLLEAKNPGNPTVAEIDEAAKFLIAKKKAGQFRALWGDFGELVNLMASGEMVVCDAWQPAVMAVKAQGKPAKYATPKEGYRAWAIGPSMLRGTQNRDAVIAYANYWLSGEPGISVTEQGYYSPSTSIKDVMDPMKYAFWYEGAPWEGDAERGINPGDLRDGGSLEERAANVAYWHQWPDEYDHLIRRWDEFLNA
ncbi:ABC transporter substrate-binding protein [Loktanella salsilacus]|jgi:putative spermidine/putrescine transport system substrate-binding protein|uniref:ABC transporter substrate-binding protein n=1 Tax=Loktanella salsilacus TaxID=195913 RepID=UPI0020B7FE79|nr:extracellular solute-binding protein [Loktanella salsilacus]UTH45280.1 extracellular solute-binding protein [Loktanella salsilacus]